MSAICWSPLLTIRHWLRCTRPQTEITLSSAPTVGFGDRTFLSLLPKPGMDYLWMQPVQFNRRLQTLLEDLALEINLCSLHWLRITERIEYKLLSLTYKVLTNIQPPYIHNLISLQPPWSTRSSSAVTLGLPLASSSLKVTDRSFRYASPCLWNQLPLSLCQPHSGTNSSISNSPIPSPITSSFFDSPPCPLFDLIYT